MNDSDVEKGLMACVHCGFCLQACPTYRETGDEADSPRGRIVLMRRAREGKVPLLSEEATMPGSAAYHLDRCLGCRACETACPSSVPYGALLEHFRNQQESSGKRPLGDRLLRDGLLATLTDPTRLQLALKAGKLTGGTIPAPVARFLGLPTDTRLPLPDDPAAAALPVPPVTPAQGEPRGRVGLLLGCVMRVLYAPAHHATVRVLAANGIETVAISQPMCCGALHGHQGKLDTAKTMARRLIQRLENEKFDALIVNSAGCGSFLKEYGHLLSDDPQWADRAAALAANVRDISEYLHQIGPRPMPGHLNRTVTYHDACHLAHGQKITHAPRALLEQIPGVKFVELADADHCCGSAGVYNFLQPEMARGLRAHKIQRILETGAQIVATANPGCLAWIQQGLLEKNAPPIEIVHPIELLDRAYANAAAAA